MLKTIDQIIAQIDIQPQQVLIEAVILTLTLDKGQEFGVNFAVINSAGSVLSVVGNGALLNTAVGFDPLRALTADGLLRGNAGRGFAADEHGLRTGFTGGNVTGFVKALEKIGKTEVLATPRLLVLNKQLAELQLGDRLGYQTFSQSAVSTVGQVQFLDVGTQLRVRPFVSRDGMIRMEVHPEKSSGSVDKTTGVPQSSTSEVTTNVMVPDGSTMVIGGLMERTVEKNQAGVPWLSGLPGIGALFRERNQTTRKKELIVLLTPRIWNANDPQGLNKTGSPPWIAPMPAAQTAPSQTAVPEVGIARKSPE